MAKPPANANPDQFIIGRGWYGNFRIARPYCDERVFRIDPAPTPVRDMVATNLLFVVACCGFHLLGRHFLDSETDVLFIYAPLGLGLMVCVLYTAIVYYTFRNAWRLGPWLIYDKATGCVELPREKVRFTPHEIVHLQYITTKRLDWGGVVNNSRLSELNLVTYREGQRKRWPLLRSIFTEQGVRLHPTAACASHGSTRGSGTGPAAWLENHGNTLSVNRKARDAYRIP